MMDISITYVILEGRFLMFKKVAVVFVACFFVTSCATLFKGTKEDVRFESKPTNAEVWIDGVKFGNAPIAVTLESKKTYTIEFRLGEKTKTVRLTNHMSAGYLVLDILAGLVPVIIDAATGAWMKLDSNDVIVDIDLPLPIPMDQF
jgi:predicted small secreted protein